MTKWTKVRNNCNTNNGKRRLDTLIPDGEWEMEYQCKRNMYASMLHTWIITDELVHLPPKILFSFVFKPPDSVFIIIYNTNLATCAHIVQLSDFFDVLDYFEITIKTCVWDFYFSLFSSFVRCLLLLLVHALALHHFSSVFLFFTLRYRSRKKNIISFFVVWV